MDDAIFNKVTWKIPNALALVGSRAGDEWNAMTTSWITQLSMEPVLIGVGSTTRPSPTGSSSGGAPSP
jgi:flavin reductase (DIM6/NTAB) family NADH-FMN oxidoreductase RutF